MSDQKGGIFSNDGFLGKLSSRFSKIYAQANRLSFGALEILRSAIRRFSRVRGAEGAASVAFFALFSFFPLLLVLVGIGGFILESATVREQVLNLIRVALPVSPELVIDYMRQVVEDRGEVSLIGLVTLAWSATGALTTLTHNIDRAWPVARPRTFIQSRMVAVGMIAALGILLFISSITNTVLGVLYKFDLPYIPDAPFWNLITSYLPFFVALIVFMALYRWVPNTYVTWRAAFWAALVADIAWEIAINAFSWYLSSGFSQFRIIYGTLGTIVAVMFWVYLLSLIIIFCAHLSASIMHRGESGEVEPEENEEQEKVRTF